MPGLHTAEGYEKVKTAVPKIKGSILNAVASPVLLRQPGRVVKVKHHTTTLTPTSSGIIKYEIERAVESLSVDTFEEQEVIQSTIAQATGMTIEFVGKSKG